MSTKQAYYKRLDTIRANSNTYKVDQIHISVDAPQVRTPVRRMSDAIFMNNLIKTQMQDFKNQYQHLNEKALQDEHFKLAVPQKSLMQKAP